MKKQRLLFLTRLRIRHLFLADGLLFGFSPLLALILRMEDFTAVLTFAGPLLAYLAIVVPVKLISVMRSGLYSEFWPHASIPEVLTMLRSLSVASVAEVFVVYALLYPLDILPMTFPRSVPLISAILGVLLVGGVRLAVRALAPWVTRPDPETTRKSVIIAGAGAAGALTAQELLANPQFGILPMAFVDDDRAKFGKRIYGLRVLGRLDELTGIAKEWHADEVIIAMPTAPGRVVRKVVESCRAAGVPSRTIPGMFEILRGTARVDQLRAVTVEDLLKRGAIQTDVSKVGAMVSGATVLVTGAGGSIGSELCRQICDSRPKEILLLGHGENSIYGIARELAQHLGEEVLVCPLIADIRDRERMEEIFRIHRPDVIYHAAAHKHVPLMEENVPDAVTNNILGTRNLVDLAHRFGTKRFVMISSDKAVNPTSVMGVTKRIAELVVQEAAMQTGKPFMTVRFGNVLGSRGSVVPLFQKQIAAGGPVTVTHPEMRRFFMTIPEAVQLVLQAGTMGEGGEVFVLDMGEQIRVVDLARDLIRLSGLEEGQDIEIKFTGLRPGEKLYEELFYPKSPIERTAHEKVLVCRHVRHDGDNGGNGYRAQPLYERRLWLETDTLIEAARQGNEPVMQAIFRKIVPQYVPPSETHLFGSASPAGTLAPTPAPANLPVQ